mmetsp:Transcript_356/g.1048  ORF Transcript_356/g.1048 Transcript_356/m.1048 type:complete len:344 (-) Transcript_356:60-1091(-)
MMQRSTAGGAAEESKAEDERTMSFDVVAPPRFRSESQDQYDYYELKDPHAEEEPPEEEKKKGWAPSGTLLVLCFAMFANSYALMNPVPYAAFMVLDFGLVDSKEDTGFYAGLIMSSFMLGRFMSSFLCGRLADKISRKFVIRAGVLSCVVFQFGFGVAPTYSFALATRFLMGLFNGLVSAAKAMLPDLFPPAEQAAAMSLVTAMWNMGQIVGTAVGGLLAGVPGNWPPYLLANLVGCALAGIAYFGVEIFLPGRRRRQEKPTTAELESDDDDADDDDDEHNKTADIIDNATNVVVDPASLSLDDAPSPPDEDHHRSGGAEEADASADVAAEEDDEPRRWCLVQ